MPRARPLHRTTAFGLPLEPTFHVHGLGPVAGTLSPSRPMTVRLGEPGELAGWGDGAAVPVYGRWGPGGEVAACIHRHPRHGHRLFAEGFGTYALSPALDELACAPPAEVEDWDWQRFLTGHVLPFAAVLSGLEVLHASAVAIDGRVIALVGGSGAGKTSLALHLAVRGARLFTDDVLALELSGADVVAHPGAGVANVCANERERLMLLAGGEVGTIVGAAGDDLRVVVERETRPLPLAAVYFIDRPTTHRRLRFEGVDAAVQLLGATFNLSIRDPARLRRHLEVCAALAQRTVSYRVAVPASVGASAVAAAIASHAGAEL